MICGSVSPRTTGVYALGGGSRARARSVMGRRDDAYTPVTLLARRVTLLAMRILMSTFE
jgi:hypothetical protein